MSDSHKTYYWDFHGPRAQGTALHFTKHLNEFLARHAIVGCQVDAWSAGEGHHAARCVAPAAAQASIEHHLRPNRSEG